jgi:uncharacterized membrane protein
MDALSEAIVRVLNRLDQTDRRLAEIEKTLGIAAGPMPQPEPEPPPATPPTRVETVAPPAPVPAPESPRLETTLGLAWINRIGAITLAIGVAFMFKYAVDSAWIGPSGRVILGVLAGLAALGFADRAWRGGQKTYAQGISGLGVAILYLSFYASFGFYHLVAPGFAFFLMALATAMAGALALRYDAPAIAALGLLGGYATPLLLSTGEDRPWTLFTWVLLLDLGALALTRLRKWQALERLAFLSTVALYGGWMFDRFTAEKRTVAAVFGFAYYAIFATSEAPPVFAFSQALIYAVMLTIWQRMAGAYSTSALLCAAAGLAISDWRRRAAGATVTLVAFWLAYWVWITDFQPAPPPTAPVFLFLTAAFLMFLGWVTWHLSFRAAPLERPVALLLAVNGAVYFGSCYDLLRKDYGPYLGLFAVALAAAHLAIAFLLWRRLPTGNRDTRPVLLALGIALTFITLAAPIQFAGYRITMAWALEMAALAWIGARTGSKAVLYAALAVFCLVLFRLNSIDAWMYAAAGDYGPIGNARFLTFAIAAAACWGAAYWVTTTGAAAGVFYFGGHYVMLWALVLEALGWTARNVGPETLASAQSAAISILMACYAVLLVAFGVVYRSAINRIVGLGLIGVVAGKLYLYDVWLLVRVYRIAAFGALGALLLLTSYVYSRNRVSIENWWNDRNAG